MELQDIKQLYNNISKQIEELKLQQDQLKLEYKSSFQDKFKEKQKIDREWFVKNFDYILKHRDYFAEKSPFKDIVIDFLPLFTYGGLVGGAGFNGSIDRIYLQDLIWLWNHSYNYESHPLIGYQKIIHNGIRQWVLYVDKGKEVKKQVSFDDSFLTNDLKMLSLNKNSYPTIWDNYKTIDILKKEV